MFHPRWFSKPAPAKPAYYNLMNPEEQSLWAIIVRLPHPIPLPTLSHPPEHLTNTTQGEEKITPYLDKRGKWRTRRLSRTERMQRQKLFFDTRVGQAVVGDDWMRMKLSGASSRKRS